MLCGLAVEVRGCAEVVQVVHDGQVVAEHPRHSRAAAAARSAPLRGAGRRPGRSAGAAGARWADDCRRSSMQPVEQRPLDLYAALAEVAR